MSDRLRRNAKASYLAFSLGRYGDRVPLGGHGPLVIYAHELDGCSWRSMTRRAMHIDDLHSMSIIPWNHNMDRGDSFEQGWGLTHGVPVGITMEYRLDKELAWIQAVVRKKLGHDIADHVRSMVQEHGVVLSGTPDFMALKGHELRIMDAKSPRKPRRDEDGNYTMKATWRSRLETYVRLAMKTLKGHDGNDLATRLREVTPWPIWPGRLQPHGSIENIHGVIVLDTGESYEFLELHVDDHDLEWAMYEKLAKALTVARILRHGRPNGFLGMSLLSDKALKRLTGVDHDDRSWQCGYCPLAHKCPMAKGHVEVTKIMAGTTWKEHMSKKGTRYRIGHDWGGDEVMTTDEELVKTSSRHDVYVRVRDKWVTTRSVMRPIGREEVDLYG